MAEDQVLATIETGIGQITLNRPSTLNALDLATAWSLSKAIERCMGDEGAEVILLTGAGRGFCSGGDMGAVQQHVDSGGTPQGYFRDLTVPLHRIITDLRVTGKPVIAAINGPAAGAGLSLVAACDLRLASDTASFKQAYTSIALVPDAGWTVLLAGIVGPARASWLLAMDPLMLAQEAFRLGLVHEVVEAGRLQVRARELAAVLRSRSATAFARAKALLNASVFPFLEVQLERERQALIVQSGTADFREGLAAFREKRQPAFAAS